MEAIQTQKPKASVTARAKRLTAMVLVTGALGCLGVCAAKRAIKPSDSVEITGLAAPCKRLPTCEVLAKAGDTIWRANVASVESGRNNGKSSIRMAGVDGQGVVFNTDVSRVSGTSQGQFRVNFDGSAENRPWALGGISVERTPNPGMAKVRIQ